MPVPRPDQRMRDLVKDGVADMIGLGMPDIVARQRDGAIGIVALTGPAAGVIEFRSPVVKPVRAHQLRRCFQRGLKRSVILLHAAQAI